MPAISNHKEMLDELMLNALLSDMPFDSDDYEPEYLDDKKKKLLIAS